MTALVQRPPSSYRGIEREMTIQALLSTPSRVIQLYNVPPVAEGSVSSLLLGRVGRAPRLWRDELLALPVAPAPDRAPALDMLRVSPAVDSYTLSTNPPNPKTSFRLGDWICPAPNCAAHNFGRNLSCIGCGCPKSSTLPVQQQQQQQHQQQHQTQQLFYSSTSAAPRPAASPRFASPSTTPSSTPPARATGPPTPYPTLLPQTRPMGYQPQLSGPPKTAHPLLTPSGRAFAVGGRVQNVSSDPLSPCIMYWPDNEPFPEQGQIRPGNLVGVTQPPILNTGNKGPISHQPGDWICKKCNYLNWRRRKVCQTCLPYAEGNGDSISAAVQAERIALLTSVLAQTELSQNATNLAPSPPRANSLTPPLLRRPNPDAIPGSSPMPPAPGRTIHKSYSHHQLGGQFVQNTPTSPQYMASSPIYQTSGHRQPSPLYSTGPKRTQGLTSDGQQERCTPPPHSSRSSPLEQKIETPAPLLPSFLQDIVQSPSLSPASTATTAASSDLPFDDEYEEVMNSRTTFPRIRGASGSSDGHHSITRVPSIWRLDGEESKSLLGFSTPSAQDAPVNSPGVIGSGRRTAHAHATTI